MNYKIIAARCNNNGIGYKNKLPWHFKTDLKHFSKTTTGNGNNAIVMGRKTWESLPKPVLPNRHNIVLSSKQPDFNYSKYNDKCINQLYFIDSIEGINMFCSEMGYDEVWIIGGSSLYKQFINNPNVNTIVITAINNKYTCDTFFPRIPSTFKISNIDIIYDIDKNHKSNDNGTQDEVELKLITCKRV